MLYNFSFGIVKKGKYKAASDFRFEFVAEVICEDPHSSGFMVELTPDRPPKADQPSDETSETGESSTSSAQVWILELCYCIYTLYLVVVYILVSGLTAYHYCRTSV